MRPRRSWKNDIDIHTPYWTGKRWIAVGVAAMLRTEVRITVEARDFSLIQNVDTGSSVHPAS
jgi:hypothetical protein